jgi:dienelactone hydrolase
MPDRSPQVLACVLTLCGAALLAMPVETAGTRLAGVRLGDYGVGLEVRRGLDSTRTINRTDPGVRIGTALWYPAGAAPTGTPAVTSLDYRMLTRLTQTEAERRAYAEQQVRLLTTARHIGIVPLTAEQARASLDTTGVARMNVAPADGRFPTVVIFGGPYYQSSTAEVLASHGFCAAAPFRFSDQRDEFTADSAARSMDNAVTDTLWSIEALRSHRRCDFTRVAALGHGGGGAQSLLFAMHSTRVSALVNIDAGNFSSVTNLEELASYEPRQLRAPYLYIATQATRASQDRFPEFLAMTSSDRVEVVLKNPSILHHDLSDLGRAVTAPMGIRGEAESDVARQYADVQEMIVRFVKQYAAPGRPPGDEFVPWLSAKQTPGTFTVTRHPGSR